MATHETLGGRQEFQVPTEERWGLTPEEQMMLFGDQGTLAPDSREAFKVMLEKCYLGAQYLISFWPKGEIPELWYKKDDERRLAWRQHANCEGLCRGMAHPMVANSVLYVPIRADFVPKYTWKDRDTDYDGAADRAMAYAMKAAGGDSEALQCIEYIVALMETNGRWGWAEKSVEQVILPEAPWCNRLEQFPMYRINEGMLF